MPKQALFGTLTLDVIVLTVLYSTAGLGIAIVNDFQVHRGRQVPCWHFRCNTLSIFHPALAQPHARRLTIGASQTPLITPDQQWQHEISASCSTCMLVFA